MHTQCSSEHKRLRYIIYCPIEKFKYNLNAEVQKTSKDQTSNYTLHSIWSHILYKDFMQQRFTCLHYLGLVICKSHKQIEELVFHEVITNKKSIWKIDVSRKMSMFTMKYKQKLKNPLFPYQGKLESTI